MVLNDYLYYWWGVLKMAKKKKSMAWAYEAIVLAILSLALLPYLLDILQVYGVLIWMTVMILIVAFVITKMEE